MADANAQLVQLQLTEVHDLAMRCLLGHGASEAQAKAVADTVTDAERDNCKSHGLFRIPGYVASLKSGKVTGDAVPVMNALSPSVLQVDAANGFAPYALQVAAQPLADMTRKQGVGVLALINGYHFAALWPEVERLTDKGLVAFAFVSASSYVAPAGGTKPLYGTNPMAFGWPRENGEAVIFDQASSASARGEIQIHHRDGKPIPEGWAIDSDGQPTTDPSAALAGAQLPFGGHKGASIALMVELLAGALVGDVFSYEASARDNNDGGPAKGGEFMLAIDPQHCRSPGTSALSHAEGLFNQILAQPGTRLPSQRRYEARRITPTEGITIVPSLHQSLLELSAG